VLLLSLAARTVLGATFLIAGVSKLLTPSSQLLETIRNYGLANDAAARITSRILPLLECCLGVFVILALWLPFTSILAISLLLVFNGLHYRALRRGRQFNCSCFGALHPTPIGFGLVLRNTGMIALGACILASVIHSETSLGSSTIFRDYTTGLTSATNILVYVGLLLLFTSALALVDYCSILFTGTSGTSPTVRH
jgi:uncharacterized membrane protein YphA (DoxX/SURF4 family)